MCPKIRKTIIQWRSSIQVIWHLIGPPIKHYDLWTHPSLGGDVNAKGKGTQCNSSPEPRRSCTVCMYCYRVEQQRSPSPHIRMLNIMALDQGQSPRTAGDTSLIVHAALWSIQRSCFQALAAVARAVCAAFVASGNLAV